MELRVDSHTVDDVTVVTPYGEVDLGNVSRLREALQEPLRHQGASVVLDLDQITFIDSAGLGALIGARRRAYGVQGSLTVVCTQPRVRRIFELTRLDRVFEIVDSHPAVDPS